MKNNRQNYVLVPFALLLAALAGTVMYFDLYIGLGAAAVSLIILVAARLYLGSLRKNQAGILDSGLLENRSYAGKIVNMISFPCLLLDREGNIRWRNPAFEKIYMGASINKLLPEMDPARPKLSMMYDNAKMAYEIKNIPLLDEQNLEGDLIFEYWIDRSEALHYKRLYEEQMPTVCLIYVDNYEEINIGTQLQRTNELAEVERRIAQWVNELGGVYRRYDIARYFVVFERVNMEEIEKKKFALLETVRNLNSGANALTLSIAVGLATRIKDSDEHARQAMELALGRGGDQAVVKQGAGYKFYGGKHQGVERQSKVKSRLFAKALRQLMENSSEFIIMGHNQLDMDCIGAALALVRCARTAACKPYIIIDALNPGIDQIIDIMKSNPEYKDILIDVEKARQIIKPASVLAVVDTQRWGSTIAPDLGETAGKLVVIDHHRRTVDAIENTTMNYLEPNSSSVSEMMSEVVQYFGENIRLSVIEAGAMLAGITIDTKRFAFNCSARTFEAASYLRRNGADSAMIKRMFQDDIDTYIQRSEVVKNVEYITDGIALSVCPAGMENATIIAAQAADELINIRGIRASFVLAHYKNDVIAVSGRSLGDINVQRILEKIGGGGHLTIAGAQIPKVTMEQAVDMVSDCVRSYLTEEGIDNEGNT